MSGTGYRAEDIVRLLRVQRHDLLNQLQVISGLLQLRKLDRALEYTWETIKILATGGTVLSLSSAELALGLMLESQRAAEQRMAVTMEVSVSSCSCQTLPEISMPVVYAVQEAWRIIAEEMIHLPVGGRLLKVRVVETTDCRTIHFFTPLTLKTLEMLCERLRQEHELAGLTGLSCGISPGEDGWELKLSLAGEHVIHTEQVGGRT